MIDIDVRGYVDECVGPIVTVSRSGRSGLPVQHECAPWCVAEVSRLRVQLRAVLDLCTRDGGERCGQVSVPEIYQALSGVTSGNDNDDDFWN